MCYQQEGGEKLCPCCGNQDTYVITKKIDLDIFRCPVCLTLFTKQNILRKGKGVD